VHARSPRGREVTKEQQGPQGGIELGWITGTGGEGIVHVSVGGQAPQPARLAIAADEARLQQAMREGELAVLAFQHGTEQPPLILGLVKLPPAMPDPKPNTRPELIRADVDGRRLHIRAEDEIVFQCGKASVTLRRNGKVIIRGTHVETNSEGTNRIKGGNVRIN
jgi:hypothetical protein